MLLFSRANENFHFLMPVKWLPNRLTCTFYPVPRTGRDIINVLLPSVSNKIFIISCFVSLVFFGPYCKLRTVPFFFLSIYGLRASRLGHKSMGKKKRNKNLVLELQYRSQSRLTRGINRTLLLIIIRCRLPLVRMGNVNTILVEAPPLMQWHQDWSHSPLRPSMTINGLLQK